MKADETYFPNGALIPWPSGPVVKDCSICAHGNAEKNECMNVYHPCEFEQRGR